MYTIQNTTEDGVYIITDNGDSHYLTHAEFKKFKENREKNGFE